MGITNHGLELMGFTELLEGASVSGVFSKLYVFNVEGLNFGEDALPATAGSINGQAFQIGFGKKLNSICNKLTDDDFVDDEAKWIQEKKVSGPFAIVQIGPTGLHISTSRYVKELNGELHTHDAFATARQEIKNMELRVIAPLVAALETTFSAGGHRVRFRFVGEAFYGVSPTGQTIHDLILVVHGNMCVSRKLDDHAFDTTLQSALQLASALDPKVANFMHLGFQEKDRLKKFLNFFLAIEIETHATFKKIEHEKLLTDLIASPREDIKDTVSSLFLTQHKKLTTLKEHFIWCVICKWKHLSDLDVEVFNRLKKVRDDIAHGNISILPSGVETEAEKFIMKIQGSA